MKNALCRVLFALLFVPGFTPGDSLHPAFAEGVARVAVFYQPGFLYYNVPAPLSPRHIADDLNRAGVPADLLDAEALANPNKLTITRYGAVIMPYGNVYPRGAFANLRAFHQAGGCLIVDAAPFTHPTVLNRNGVWNDTGHTDDPARFGPNGIGVGGFRSGPSGKIVPAKGDPLHLAGLKISWGDGDAVQTLDPATLPAGDTIVPALVADQGAPVAQLIVHGGDAFSGAVDFWATHAFKGEDTTNAYATEQLLARGAIAALAQKGLLTDSARAAAYASLDRIKAPLVPFIGSLPQIPRRYPTLQRKSAPPAQHLYVADAHLLKHDQQLLLATLQGVVNRGKPRIYLLWKPEDRFWLNEMIRRGQTGAPIRVADPLSLVSTFRSSIRGAVIPDPKVYVSPCIAVDFAGLEDLVIATPALAEQLRLPIREDLRGKFKDNADALHYARTVLMKHLNPFLSISISPDILGPQIDDIVAGQGMAFWVTGPLAQNLPGADEQAERAELEQTFAAMPIDAVVHGYWWHGDGVGLDETPGVSMASRYGKITTVSDFVSNYSVTSGVVVPELKQKPHPAAPKLDPTKVYLAITVTDGDNLCTWREYFRQYFTDKLHGAFPIAFGMAPTLIDVAPTEMQWYYEHALPTDEFFCDVSGVGYTNPYAWGASIGDREGAYRSFYKWTADYMKRTDLHTLRLNLPSRADILRAADELPDVQYLIPDYGYAGEKSYEELTFKLPDGKPVFRGITNTDARHMAGQIRERLGTQRPAFLNAVIVNWGMTLSDLKGMLDDLGPEYVPVLPSQLNTLYREANP